MRKFLPYILIVIMLVGLFSLVGKANAEFDFDWPASLTPPGSSTESFIIEGDSLTPPGSAPGAPKAAAAVGEGKELEKALGKCSLMSLTDGCLQRIIYWIFYLIPTFLLTISARFFDFIIALTLSSALYTQADFINNAWAVVRDLSNIFFILILLYIAIKMILGLGGSEVKKMIARVIIVALLINFSMFFTKIVIDSSNILALVFYNKINVTTVSASYEPILNLKDAGVLDKDVAGEMMGYFDPTKMLSREFFDKLRKTSWTPGGKLSFTAQVGGGAVIGSKIGLLGGPLAPVTVAKGAIIGGTAGLVSYISDAISNNVPIGIIVGITITAGLIMAYAAYAFFIVGFSFLARMIELWILIIFSPFAFMSFALPFLAKVEYLGWESWIKRLLKVAFMAPIFMFFLFLIFMIIQSDIWTSLITRPNTKDQGWLETMILIIIPALVILTILMKATKFAKDASGELGKAIIGGAKILGGVALGVATGGTAMALSGTVGRLARNTASNEGLKAKALAGDKGAQRKLALANSLAKNSFDFRQTGMGKFASKQSGMNFNQGLGIVGMSTEKLKGGRKERDKEAIEEGIETRKTYRMSEAAAQKHDRQVKGQNDRAEEYKKDKETAQKHAKENTYDFKEEDFKSDYEKEGEKSLGRHGVEKTVTGGSIEKVNTSKEINKERDEAYALSLENPTKKIEDGQAIKKSLKDLFKEGTITGGLSITAPITLFTGGITNIIKARIQEAALESKNKLVRSAASAVFVTHEDVVAGIRKGEDPRKWFKDTMKDIAHGKPVSEEKVSKAAKIVEEASGGGEEKKEEEKKH